MLEKLTDISQIEVLKSGCVQVRESIIVMENGVELSKTYHRHCIAPGDNYSNEAAQVKAVCSAAQTPEVIAAYEASLPVRA